jgi:hypothetical protein
MEVFGSADLISCIGKHLCLADLVRYQLVAKGVRVFFGEVCFLFSQVWLAGLRRSVLFEKHGVTSYSQLKERALLLKPELRLHLWATNRLLSSLEKEGLPAGILRMSREFVQAKSFIGDNGGIYEVRVVSPENFRHWVGFLACLLDSLSKSSFLLS